MANAISGLDHVLVGADDLAACAGTWARLGFTLTPLARHPGQRTSNCCIMFARDYVELSTTTYQALAALPGANAFPDVVAADPGLLPSAIEENSSTDDVDISGRAMPILGTPRAASDPANSTTDVSSWRSSNSSTRRAWPSTLTANILVTPSVV